MTVQDLVNLKKYYIARKRMLEPARFVNMDELQALCGGELENPMIPGLPMEEILRRHQAITEKAEIIEQILGDQDLDVERFQTYFDAMPEAFWQAISDSDPVVKPVPEKLVLMTFDDATLDHYEYVAPIFEKYNARANFFVCEPGDPMPGAKPKAHMNWNQIKELHDRSHEIVNHSWHHSLDFLGGDENFVRQEIQGIDRLCEENGIRKPIAFGYPGGGCTAKEEVLLHQAGYLWARGDMKNDSPHRNGQSYYDPYIDSPLAMPSYNGAPRFDEARIRELLSLATDSRVLIFAYHAGDETSPLTLEEQVRCIYESGGRCITFSELGEYIDPKKAYAYSR